MDAARLRRQDEIRRALTFIQSPLAYPDPDGYQDFLSQLVRNLLEEGNSFFQDGAPEDAVREFSEGLNVASYAEAGDVSVPAALRESLYVNRAAAYHSLAQYSEGVCDCDAALQVCVGSSRALYRKAECLKELRRFKEAYSCLTSALLHPPVDPEVSALAQQLSVHLGLKGRKPYVSAKVLSETSGNILQSVSSSSFPSPVHPSIPPPSIPPSPLPPSLHPLLPPGGLGADGRRPGQFPRPFVLQSGNGSVGVLAPGEWLRPPGLAASGSARFCLPIRDPGLLVNGSAPSGLSLTGSAPSGLPAPTPQLPPAFFSSAVRQLNTLDSFSDLGPAPSSSGCSSSAAALDLLNHLGCPAQGGLAPSVAGGLDALDALDVLDALDDFSDPIRSGPEASRGAEPLDELDPVDPAPDHVLEPPGSLDTLDAFPPRGGAAPVVLGGRSLDSLSEFSGADLLLDVAPPPLTSSPLLGPLAAAAKLSSKPQHRVKVKEDHGPYAVSNPLFNTHDFLQACSTCFPREGKGIYSFVHKPHVAHSCSRDVLLCRRKNRSPSEWTRIRPVPLNSFTGPFVLCREVLSSGDLGLCKYGENCTFAYNQLEIDVWTEERKGTLDRVLLFDSSPAQLDPVNSIRRLLQENKGLFAFLCEECYDNKPRIISRRCSNNPTVCSNQDVHHSFDANKCLVFVVRSHNVLYHKVRPLGVLSSLDLCRQAICYGCTKDDQCIFAHSVIELKTWRVQTHTGISHDEIVKVSDRFYEEQELNSSKLKANRTSGGAADNKPRGAAAAAAKNPALKMKFCCSHCWRDGLISEPDKQLKFCSARARHAWTKERRVLLVRSVERSKWVQVRPLPHAKNPPFQYEICVQVLRKRRCTFIGNCSFAHSPEEKEMWMYMKNNNMMDMQQMYEMWLKIAATANSRPPEEAPPPSEEKSINMPTDYAEPMSGFYCRLCGRHSNSERQWQQHISSEKHKDKVFSSEGEDHNLLWSFRFPGAQMTLCPLLDAGCPDGACCDSAHSAEELEEWAERRRFLRQKLARAREDMLIMPDEFDFGKFNFLLQD